MLLFWRIRYLDSRNKQLKDRDLALDTTTLDAVSKAAIEVICERGNSVDRRILRFRHLFREDVPTEELNDLCLRSRGMNSFSLVDYVEDETGMELTPQRFGFLLTGNEKAVVFPSRMRPHDIEYALSDKEPIHMDDVSLTDEQCRVLGYFTRDLHEMLAAAFLRDGRHALDGNGMSLQSTTGKEEVGSFVMIFRRLYMQDEPGSFIKALVTFNEGFSGYPITKWVMAHGCTYRKELDQPPSFFPFPPYKALPFTQKRLIDVFLYTEYAHQPNERRERQYRECLAAVDGKKGALTWLFLSEIQRCAAHMTNVGRVIAHLFDGYCKGHKVFAEVLPSMAAEHPGLGTLEKECEKRARVFEEKVKEVAHAKWESAGRPPGGSCRFTWEAQKELAEALQM